MPLAVVAMYSEISTRGLASALAFWPRLTSLTQMYNKRELFVVAMSMSLMLYTRKAVESLQQRVTEVLWIGVC